MAKKDDSDKYRAPALDKGLDILELLSASDVSLSQAEISKLLDRSPNEIYRMLDRLVRRDFVRRTQDDRYEITLKLFELAYQRPPLNRLVSQAMPVMRQLALDSEQACHLVIRDRNLLVVVAQVDGPSYWNVSLRIGSRMGLVDTGSGHIFLAFATPEERKLMLEEQDLAAPKDLENHLQVIKKQGFENMISKQTATVRNLSFPVFGPLGSVIAALTCPYSARLDKPEAPTENDTIDLLRDAAKHIMQRSKNT